MKKDEIFIPRKFKETKNNHKTQKKIKANHNLMKLKAQTEILEDKTAHYKTKYQKIYSELITVIKELCRTERQQFLIELWKKTTQRKKKN